MLGALEEACDLKTLESPCVCVCVQIKCGVVCVLLTQAWLTHPLGSLVCGGLLFEQSF